MRLHTALSVGANFLERWVFQDRPRLELGDRRSAIAQPAPPFEQHSESQDC